MRSQLLKVHMHAVGKRPLVGRLLKKQKSVQRDNQPVKHIAPLGKKLQKVLKTFRQQVLLPWQRATEINQEEQQYNIKAKKLEILTQRMTFEKQLISAETKLYDFQSTAVDTLDKAVIVQERKK
ncbi:hypothetical protein Dimus_036058 [Dionaea muscipula]